MRLCSNHHIDVKVNREVGRMRIGELSARTGVSRRLLRYYEEQGLIVERDRMTDRIEFLTRNRDAIAGYLNEHRNYARPA
jgi:predicted transcriptional regulator